MERRVQLLYYYDTYGDLVLAGVYTDPILAASALEELSDSLDLTDENDCFLEDVPTDTFLHTAEDD